MSDDFVVLITVKFAVHPNVEPIVLNKRASNCSMIENITPNEMSFSVFICIFAMSVEDLFDRFCNAKLSASSDMTKY